MGYTVYVFQTVENSQDGWELFTPEDNKTKLIRDQHYQQLFQVPVQI